MEYTFNYQQIEDFKSQWPCNGLPKMESITFEMEANGDLVGIIAINADGEWIDSSEFDGPALLALSENARQVVLSL